MEKQTRTHLKYAQHGPVCQVLSQINRAVFKWLSKVITWLRLLRLVIGLKDSRQFFSQWEAKPKPTAPCSRDFSRASSKLQVIARNCDWFNALFVPVVIGRSNCFSFGFRQSFENRSSKLWIVRFLKKLWHYVGGKWNTKICYQATWWVSNFCRKRKRSNVSSVLCQYCNFKAASANKVKLNRFGVYHI